MEVRVGQKKVEIKESTFQNLIGFMESEVEVREMADKDSGTNRLFKTHEEISQHENADEESLCTATALHIKPVQICTFCGHDHKPLDCRTLMSVEDRFQKVRETKACFRCAMPRHCVANCKWKKRCNINVNVKHNY